MSPNHFNDFFRSQVLSGCPWWIAGDRQPEVVPCDDGDFAARMDHGRLGEVNHVRLALPPLLYSDNGVTIPHAGGHMVVLQLTGSTVFSQGKQRVRVRPGEMLLTYDMASLRVENETPIEHLVLIDPLKAAGLHHGGGRGLHHYTARDARARLAFAWWCDACLDPTWIDPTAADDLAVVLVRLLAEVLDAPAAGPAPHRLTLPLVESHLRRHLQDQDLTLQRVANELGCNVRSLQRLFARDGQTLSHRLRRLRTQALAASLRDPALQGEPVSVLAQRCGFSSAAHGSNLFRVDFGLSPSQYRKRVRTRDAAGWAGGTVEHLSGPAGTTRLVETMRRHLPGANDWPRQEGAPHAIVPDPENFDAHMTSGRLGGLRYCHLRMSPSEILHPRAPNGAIRACLVIVQLRGRSLVEAAGRHSELDPGELLVLTGAEPSRIVHFDVVEQLVVEATWDDETGPMPPAGLHRLGASHGFGPVLARWLHDACLTVSWESSHAAEGLASVLLRLTALALIRPQSTEAMSLRRPTREAVERHVQENLANPHLDLAGIAAEFCCSVRTLLRLFRQDGGESLASYIWRARLEACAEAIRASPGASASVIDLALDHGFKSAAHFSSRFRKHYGLSPTAYRRWAAEEGERQEPD